MAIVDDLVGSHCTPIEKTMISDASLIIVVSGGKGTRTPEQLLHRLLLSRELHYHYAIPPDDHLS